MLIRIDDIVMIKDDSEDNKKTGTVIAVDGEICTFETKDGEVLSRSKEFLKWKIPCTCKRSRQLPACDGSHSR